MIYEYLLLDGIWEKTKGYGWDENTSVLLCGLGITPEGKRQIIGFSLEREESTESWRRFISSLKKRGLKGTSLKLVIADDHAGLKAGVEQEHPAIQVQTCIVHKMRRAMGQTSCKNRSTTVADLKNIFSSQTKEEAIEKAKTVVKTWYMTERKAMESLRFNFASCLTYFNFPKELWTKVRTTNSLEREFRECRRRMKVFDNTFQSESSAMKYANTLANYLNSNYPLKAGLHTNV